MSNKNKLLLVLLLAAGVSVASAAEPTDIDAAVTWAGTIWDSIKAVIIGITVVVLGRKLLKKAG